MAPQCRCYVVPILCTPEEMAQMQRNILAGNEAENDDFHSVNEVKTPPKEFTDWVKDNQERIARAKSLPYFLRDNGKVVGGKYVYGGFRVQGSAPSFVQEAKIKYSKAMEVSIVSKKSTNQIYRKLG